MPVVQNVVADLDGSGKAFVVQGWNDAGTSVSLDNVIIWKTNANIPGPGSANPAGSGWKRTVVDCFIVLDIDHDGRDEIFVVNNKDRWVGVLKWDGKGLTYPWGSWTPVAGPAGGWIRNTNDEFSVATYGGGPAIAVKNPNGWNAIFACQSGAVQDMTMWKVPPDPLPVPTPNPIVVLFTPPLDPANLPIDVTVEPAAVPGLPATAYVTSVANRVYDMYGDLTVDVYISRGPGTAPIYIAAGQSTQGLSGGHPLGVWSLTSFTTYTGTGPASIDVSWTS